MLMLMESSADQLIWVKREASDSLPEATLRERAGIEDPEVEVRTETPTRWAIATIPAGSRDEWGTLHSEVLNVGYGQLPPEGRLYLVQWK
jgi:hypothetical protein